MLFVGKVLWFIESNFRKSVDLDAIADACGVSRFHMCRGFAAVTGYPVMEYVRGRRLTEAARELAAGAPSILDVALEAGYGSHEAFTRAFRDWFGVTPESVREGGAVDQCLLMEPIRMERAAKQSVALAEPRRETAGPRTIVGLSRTYRHDAVAGIPAQWTEFQAYEGTLGERPGLWFGVCDQFNEAESTFRYTCGVEADAARDIPEPLSVIKVPRQTYLAFSHPGHISGLQETMGAIWGDYMPGCPFEAEGDAPMLEVYDEKFDPRTGLGGIEIWIPVKE